MSANGGGLDCWAAAVAMAVLLASRPARADSEMDRQECAAQLVGLATCLAYVQGDAAAPTPDCCSGLKGVLAGSPMCLCVLVKDRDDPSLGLKINLTRALNLPASCGAPANVSRCPELLNMPPNSPDAQLFKNFTAGSNGERAANGDTASDERGGGSSVHGSSAGYGRHGLNPAGGWGRPGVKHLFAVLLLSAFAVG